MLLCSNVNRCVSTVISTDMEPADCASSSVTDVLEKQAKDTADRPRQIVGGKLTAPPLRSSLGG